MLRRKILGFEKVKSILKKLQSMMSKIKLIQEQKREWSKEFIEDNNLPKKRNSSSSCNFFKKKVDMEVVSEIYSTVTGES